MSSSAPLVNKHPHPSSSVQFLYRPVDNLLAFSKSFPSYFSSQILLFARLPTHKINLKLFCSTSTCDENTQRWGANSPESGRLTDFCIPGLLNRALSQGYGGVKRARWTLSQQGHTDTHLKSELKPDQESKQWALSTITHWGTIILALPSLWTSFWGAEPTGALTDS